MSIRRHSRPHRTDFGCDSKECTVGLMRVPAEHQRTLTHTHTRSYHTHTRTHSEHTESSMPISPPPIDVVVPRARDRAHSYIAQLRAHARVKFLKPERRSASPTVDRGLLLTTRRIQQTVSGHQERTHRDHRNSQCAAIQCSVLSGLDLGLQRIIGRAPSICGLHSVERP